MSAPLRDDGNSTAPVNRESATVGLPSWKAASAGGGAWFPSKDHWWCICRRGPLALPAELAAEWHDRGGFSVFLGTYEEAAILCGTQMLLNLGAA